MNAENAALDDDDFDDDDDDIDYDGNDPARCLDCGRTLTDREIHRYYNELDVWVKKHGTPWIDAGLIAEDAGIRRDCDKCAVERLRAQSDLETSKTFMDRCIAGGPEGWWLVAAAILAFMLLMALTNGR